MPECSSSWSKAGDWVTFAGMFSADMRSPTSVSPTYTSAQCSAGSQEATFWWVRNKWVSGGFQNYKRWSHGKITVHYDFATVYALKCLQGLIINVPFNCTVSLWFTAPAILDIRAVQAIGFLLFLTSHDCGLLIDGKLSFENSDSMINYSNGALAGGNMFGAKDDRWVYLCALGIAVPTSMWKSSCDTLVESRVGERSTSTASDSILWKTDTILQFGENVATGIHRVILWS